MPRSVLAFLPDQHSFFDDLVTMLMSLSSYLFTMQVAKLSNRPTEFRHRKLGEWISYVRPIVDPEHYLSLEARSTNDTLIFFPFWIITHIALNGWPQFIECRHMPRGEDSSLFKLSSDEGVNLISRIVGSSFISYYESQKDAVQSKYGSDTQTWPETLNFARHVRNGFAHGGTFNITNPNVPAVRWRIWTLDPSFNGNQVLFAPKGIGIGDIVYLLEDVDRLL
jgi:hypothetical protein